MDRKGKQNLKRNIDKMLEKGKKIIWTEKESKILKEIKIKWYKDLELRLSDFDLNFALKCDASDIDPGAVFRQNNKALAYIFRSFKGSALNYGITDREVLACLWSMEKLQYFLLGKRFTIYTDHKSILEIRNKPESGSKHVQRWKEILDKFDFEVVYKKGSEIVESDSLSRSTESFEELSIVDKSEILKIHENFCHRKDIIDECSFNKIKLAKKLLEK